MVNPGFIPDIIAFICIGVKRTLFIFAEGGMKGLLLVVVNGVKVKDLTSPALCFLSVFSAYSTRALKGGFRVESVSFIAFPSASINFTLLPGNADFA